MELKEYKTQIAIQFLSKMNNPWRLINILRKWDLNIEKMFKENMTVEEAVSLMLRVSQH